MAMRSKRVTDPLTERAKDRIVGRDKMEIVYTSSGSEHSDQIDDSSSFSSSSSCQSLSYLIHCFNEFDDQEDLQEDVITNDQDSDSSDSDRIEAKVDEIVTTLCNLDVDRFRNVLYANVAKAMQYFQCVEPKLNPQVLNRNVMFYLQKIGYNAAICKTKWPSCGGLAAGNYEFIDVVQSDTRYFVDLNFSGEFEIARETNEFHRLFTKLPNVFIGKSDELKVIVKLMSDEIRWSLKSRGLVLPPWRKNRFMQNKWFGPYRRTTNYSSSNSASGFSVPVNGMTSNVTCSMIGFSVIDNVPLLHAATRTR
ncbi:PDDEXK-like protein [Artemisia annua]|uniref:PDDEXK-like protein n=1 Tax=Artemisia annua TaxID=35608 RepID=A0A2U1LF29_ARTAN|nr:PDDEXK-like protein [Artemisia annua]